MRILVANHHLFNVGGSELYTFALIKELKRRNLEVEYFTFRKGLISDKIENELHVPFMSGTQYDLILASHATTVEFLYGKGRIIQTCHGISYEIEQPSFAADHHVAISEEVAEFLQRCGYKSSVIVNGIDCREYRPLSKINSSINCILSICQSETAHEIIRTICLERGYHFLCADKLSSKSTEIHKLINQADLVVGIGRSAFDAMACGRPVIIFDNRDYSGCHFGGYLNSDNFQRLLYTNCTGRGIQSNPGKEDIEAAFDLYNPEDGEVVRNLALTHLNIEHQTQKYLDIHYEMQNRKSPSFCRKSCIRTRLFFKSIDRFLYKRTLPVKIALHRFFR